MPINQTYAQYSDLSVVSAMAVYFLALLLHAAESAFGRQALKREAKLAAVAAGGGGTAVAERPAPPPPRERPLPERLGRMGVALTVLGALLHLASLVLRGLATSRVPWGNMYEYISAVCLAAVVAWLVMVRRHPVRQLGAFVLTPIGIMLFIAAKLLYAEAAPVVPALRSYWIVIHVSAAVIASGAFLVAGVISLLYVVKASNEANPKRFAGLAARLPESAALDKTAYRVSVFGFPLLTFGIIAGAVWAESAWGRYWGWDPKETVAFISWVIYAAYLHSRATAGWRGTRAAWVNVAGFAATVFNLFFVNLVTTGLHSYAGV
ncbi:c-type cytochrome biogenesis protein CcsB [Streptoalloteichus hindustanus]|uniref:Cytochrome c-type biogenesis protein CcsB n=1 Tax=Streptoalloteichus hindustanus TaxID=2017 RepID=A0A1M4TUY0_STRHI|nr:c-type cytochrome biogenesis protein CcsB [Streptoalloteichus hindustanus]SHE48280.1 cytochrome c-type biogenesis protein CcsB [Streptoalloteichus hindustanus]